MEGPSPFFHKAQIPLKATKRQTTDVSLQKSGTEHN